MLSLVWLRFRLLLTFTYFLSSPKEFHYDALCVVKKFWTTIDTILNHAGSCFLLQ